jgi:hypothetical protein
MDREDEFDPRRDDHDDASSDAEGTTPDDAARPAVFITTAQPVDVRVERLDDERAPDGTVLAAFIGGRMVARSAMDADSIDRLLALELFESPVPLGLFAFEEEPGLQCRLFALVPSSTLAAAAHADEPWKASVPSYEDRAADDDDDADEEDEDDTEGDEDDEDAVSMETVLLGHIVRFAADRKHPDDLAAEALDVLQKIVGGGTLSDANEKAIDDLLKNL